MTISARALGLTAAAVISVPAVALAAAPGNDQRTAPTVLNNLPAQVSGTTEDATRVASDPTQSCGLGNQVWYRVTAPADGRLAVRVQAEGDLDAIVEAYRVQRSQTTPLGCDFTDAKGVGALDLRVKKGEAFLLAVTQRTNSVAGDFALTVVVPEAPARPPGPRLPRGGADGTLDRVGNVEDAYSVRMRQGRTYRVRLSGRNTGEDDGCRISAALYAPGTSSFEDGDGVRGIGCDEDGYATFTPGPGEGGRYSVLVSADRGVRTLQRYHLEVAGAGADDTAPGRFLSNRVTSRGALNGARVDAVDLYRFTVARRSDLSLSLDTGGRFDMRLLNERGRPVQCACGESGGDIRRQLAAGRYYVALRARDATSGSYRLRRITRVLTRTAVGFSRRRAGLGASTPIGVRVRPGVSGPVTVTIQRFDPLSGWIFHRIVRSRAGNGRASVGFVAPTVGRWRAKASFDGTVGAGSSESGFAQVLVVGS